MQPDTSSTVGRLLPELGSLDPEAPGPSGSGAGAAGSGSSMRRTPLSSSTTALDEDIFSAIGGLELGSNDPSDHLSGGGPFGSGADGGHGGLLGVDHGCGELPSRTLLVRNVGPEVSDDDVHALFGAHGDVRQVYSAAKGRGFVMVSFYDLRSAARAAQLLQGAMLAGRSLDVMFSTPGKGGASDEQAAASNQGMIVLYNLDPNTTNEQLAWIFGRCGDVRSVNDAPGGAAGPGGCRKVVEFFDVRHAVAALRAMNRAEQSHHPGGMAALAAMQQQQAVAAAQAQRGMVRPSSGLVDPAPPPINLGPVSSSWDPGTHPDQLLGLLTRAQQGAGSGTSGVTAEQRQAAAAVQQAQAALQQVLSSGALMGLQGGGGSDLEQQQLMQRVASSEAMQKLANAAQLLGGGGGAAAAGASSLHVSDSASSIASAAAAAAGQQGSGVFNAGTSPVLMAAHLSNLAAQQRHVAAAAAAAQQQQQQHHAAAAAAQQQHQQNQQQQAAAVAAAAQQLQRGYGSSDKLASGMEAIMQAVAADACAGNNTNLVNSASFCSGLNLAADGSGSGQGGMMMDGTSAGGYLLSEQAAGGSGMYAQGLRSLSNPTLAATAAAQNNAAAAAAAAAQLLGGGNAAAAAAMLQVQAGGLGLQELAARQSLHQQAAAASQLQQVQQQQLALQQLAQLQAQLQAQQQLAGAANIGAAQQLLQAAAAGSLTPQALAAAGLLTPAAYQLVSQLHSLQALGSLQAAAAAAGAATSSGMKRGVSSGSLTGSERSRAGSSGGGGGRLSRRAADPAAEADRKAQQEKLFALDIGRILNGEDKRTTLMIKNIPNKYTQKMLLQTIEETFKGTFDFFYLPIDFKNKCNVGYAFINMILPIHIPPLLERFNHRRWDKFNSKKVCVISYARIQGRAALVSHFQNSSLMHEDKRCRPVLFHVEGPEAGQQEPFPVGPNVRPRLGGGSASSATSAGGRDGRGEGGGGGGLRGGGNGLSGAGGSSGSLNLGAR